MRRVRNRPAGLIVLVAVASLPHFPAVDCFATPKLIHQARPEDFAKGGGAVPRYNDAHLSAPRRYSTFLEYGTNPKSDEGGDGFRKETGALFSTVYTNDWVEPPGDDSQEPILERVLGSFWGPRLLLAAAACLYATNFPLGAIMDDALPASAATSGRMLLAALALSPFVPRLKRELIPVTLLAGCCTSVGYVTQSLSLVDTNPATVSFLGAAIVLVCPTLEWLFDKKPMGLKDAPQTWLAALLCMAGVGVLELWDPSGASGGVSFQGVGTGDLLALVQAVGFGGGLYGSERMVRDNPDQALPVTATMVATTAFFSMIWAFSDGWPLAANSPFSLPELFMDPSLHTVAMAVAWTGLVSTSLNFCLEVQCLSRVPSAEASVILSTEPIWAALFSAVVLHESLGWNDTIGGALIVMACLANTLKPDNILRFFENKTEDDRATSDAVPFGRITKLEQ